MIGSGPMEVRLRLAPDASHPAVDAAREGMANAAASAMPALNPGDVLAVVLWGVLSAPPGSGAIPVGDGVPASPAGGCWILEDDAWRSFLDRGGSAGAVAREATGMHRLLAGAEPGKDHDLEAAFLDQVLACRAVAGLPDPVAVLHAGPEGRMRLEDWWEPELVPSGGGLESTSRPTDRAGALCDAVMADLGSPAGEAAAGDAPGSGEGRP